MNKLYLCLIAGFFLIVSLFGEVPEEEILILTEQDVIILPEGKVSATLNEIEAPAELINALQTLEAQEIRKAMPEFNRADTMRISPDGNIARLPDFSQLFAIRLPLAVNRDSAIIMLENLPQIIRGEKNQRGEDFQICPNDTHFNKQWSLHNTGQWGGTPDADIDAAEAWEYSTGSNSVILGIVERDNADWTHDDFGDKMFGDQYTPGDHTTHVAGIMAAIGNNDLGVAGVDWHARINTQRAAGYAVPEIVQAMIDAVNAGSKAINCSWGMPDYSQNVYDAFVSAYQMGALPVAAMPYPDRNWENPNGFGPWMLAVNASNDDDDFASYTVEKRYVDIAAPGGEEYGTAQRIYSTLPNDSYGYNYGTSMAAPHATGVTGLLLAANPNLKNYDLEWIMKLTADDKGAPGWDDRFGYGRLNAASAVKRVIVPYELARNDASSPTMIAENVLIYFMNRAGQVESGTYVCDVYRLQQVINFPTPYAVPPYGWFSLIGYDDYNPNYCRDYLYMSASTTSMTLRTYFYWVKIDLGQNPVYKWAPVNPNMIPRKYVILGRKPINTPSNLQAKGIPSSNSIKLTWYDNSHNELKFKIERSTNGTTFYLYDSVGQNVRQYVDNGTTQGQKYWYKVQAWAQEFYSNYSNIDDAVAGLAAPSNLIAVNLPTLTSVKLQWADNSLIEAGFQIARRVDDGAWNDNYKTVGADVTQYTDTVSFTHKYNYKVRAYDSQSNYSEWSNTIEFTSGTLAQSDYPEMSAFNNQKKVMRGTDGKIHLIYYNGTAMYHTYSTDHGVNFNPWFHLYVNPVDTTPGLALNGNEPFVVYGSNEYFSVSDYRVRYYILWIRDPLPFPRRFYNSSATTQNSRPMPPSIVYAGDSCYFVFKHYNGSIMVVGPTPNNTAILTYSSCGHLPSIGYDGAGRLVVVVKNDGIAQLYYRPFNSTWSAVMGIPDHIWVYGTPSLWVGNNEVRIAFEGGYTDATGDKYGLVFLRFTWSSGSNTYILQQIELITENTDWSAYGIEGYSFFASTDIVLWKYQDDIWYSRRAGGSWSGPVNISNTPINVSSYPHGVVFRSGIRDKLFALWTEEVGNDYYLVRKIISLPNDVANPIDGVQQGTEMQYTGPFYFESIYPNPTKGVMKIRFMSPDQRKVTVRLYDVTGRMVKKLFDGRAKIGLNEIPHCGKNLPSGVYFVRLITEDKLKTEKVIFYR